MSREDGLTGNETSTHLLENVCIPIMLCAFEGPPNVLRIYGQGWAHLPGSPRWKELRPFFPDLEGARQIVTVRVERVQTSCGYAVPFMEFKAHHTMLTKWTAVKGVEGLEEYRTEKNEASIDGLATHRARQKQSLAVGSPP